jgi:hypothetical protein
VESLLHLNKQVARCVELYQDMRTLKRSNRNRDQLRTSNMDSYEEDEKDKVTRGERQPDQRQGVVRSLLAAVGEGEIR